VMCIEWQKIGWSKNYRNGNPVSTRLTGRPKTRWENDVKGDLSIMKMNNWTKRIQGRVKWKEVAEKSRTLKKWSCSAWRRGFSVYRGLRSSNGSYSLTA
jgi:hypothetical protein